MPGGLYKVKNMAGGTCPKDFKGMWTDLGLLEERVAEFNKENNKEGK